MSNDASTIEAFRTPIDPLRRAAGRDLSTLTELRATRRPSELHPSQVAVKLTGWIEQVRAHVDGARDRLTSEEGRAALAEVEAWIETQDLARAELGLLAEAFDQFRVGVDVEGFGDMDFLHALDVVERNFDRDPERVVLAWDAVKKLVGRFQDPRLAAVPEIAQVLERHRGLEQRVATELRPLIARTRTAPLIEEASNALEALGRGVDDLDEDEVLRRRQELRDGLAPLARDWADVPEVQAFVATCARAFRSSEAALGDRLVVRELQAAEAFVKPLVERVERALALGSASRVREHAPRLRARLGDLAPFLTHQRAELLHGRAEAALARIELTLAREVAEAEAVPRFDLDLAADTTVQAHLTELNLALDTFRDEHTQAQLRFEDGVDLVNGGASCGLDDDVTGTARTLIRFARRAEEVAGELRAVDRAHPALAIVDAAVPRLIARAQAWKARLETRLAYARAIEEVRSASERAEGERPSDPDPQTASYAWPQVLDALDHLDGCVAAARALLPDDHDEADAWAARAALLRDDARTKLAAVCVAEATRLATDNDPDSAERYAEVLRAALPDAPENAQIAAVIAGTADARQQAEAEIAAGAARIREDAEAAARELRPAYDAWVEERAPIVALAGSIVADVAAYRGKWIAGHARHLGLALADEPEELHGDIYQLDYDPAVRAQLRAGMARLDERHAAMAEAVVARHGVHGVCTTTQHYPRDAHYVCEIVGVTQYTPRREIRDGYGHVLGTVDGPPYPVPRLVIRAVATTYFVIVPWA